MGILEQTRSAASSSRNRASRGRWYGHRSAYDATATTAALVANALYGTPFYVPTTIAINGSRST